MACALEKAATVASVWRGHYDRLHLHTDRGHSSLPGMPMPRGYPRYPSRAQVGPVQILPRELLGLPILTWAIAQARLPARLADFINAPAIRLAVGSLKKLGLKTPAKGPRRMIEEDHRVPLLDVGTLARIRDGSIAVRGGIKRFTPDGVAFVDSPAEPFDDVILATGFRPDLRALLPDVGGVFDERGMPLATGQATQEPGLFFCGLVASPTGQLREIGLEAVRIAQLAAGIRASR
ncbi:hypothetical protein I6J77_11370 [Rhodanobacter sp. FDAARGOS 1247]|uniref:hypothetical protein n=1 Tax=Rhodanobacter sp. FDAARGOS 1247 TaxID=2778082 RepID=UPI00194F2C28|nr:hypothetical protein [Rhodanobacter sp. FDAARGOS 1247]QRP62734.1 hypothetical protein I6J77_11370 [Rhodanobacter sp. FDAARGOS 1247]